MANASHKKKRPNKQHDVRGASLLRIAKRLRANAKEFQGTFPTYDYQLGDLLKLIADACESEGKSTRHLR